MSGVAHAKCEVFYATRSQIKGISKAQQDIATLSSALNAALKSSFSLVNTVDHFLLGIPSAVLLRGPSLDDIKPTEWDKLKIQGSLVYRDQPFSVVPIRGATLEFSSKDRSYSTVSGTQGEFAALFYELVPYSRLRLFPATLTFRDQYVISLKMPIDVHVKSKVCDARFKLTEVALEPVSLIAVDDPE